MKNFLIQLLRLITYRCEYCGGELEDWSEKKAFCVKCKSKN